MRDGNRALALIVPSVAGLALLACADLNDKQWYQDARGTSAKAVAAVSDSTGKVFHVSQHYLQERDLLKTFHDAGEHSEAAVLQVLHRSGVGRSSAPSAHVGKTPSASASLPTQYGGSVRWPLEQGIVSSEYGPRWGKMHKGLDIAADAGDPVYAIAAGEVIYAGDGLRGYGNVVIIRHDERMTSLYAHNKELMVHQGDQVAQGTVIALLGSTGHSTGPHVHFEIREGDAAVDPRGLLPKKTLVASAEGTPSRGSAPASVK